MDVRSAFWLLVIASCARPPADPKPAPVTWLCLPGREDACAYDVSATSIEKDGSRRVEPFVPNAAPKLDCFYVYPTVDMGLVSDNHTDFRDLSAMRDVTLAQAARLRESCALYVPLYRQVTIGTYLHGGGDLEERLAVAYADVEAAFREYLATYNRGRPIVVVGHSQGAEMVKRLVSQFFDHDEAMRARLVLALPIGGEVDRFDTIPPCSAPDQTACFVAFRTFQAGASPRGKKSTCVAPNDGPLLSGAYFPLTARSRRHIRGMEGITTPFVVFHDRFAAECAESDGSRYLAVRPVADDPRPLPFSLDDVPFQRAMGLHILDFQLAQGDIAKLVARHAR